MTDALCREAGGTLQLLETATVVLLFFLSAFTFDYCLSTPVLQLTFCVVARVTRVSEGCQIELRLFVLAITEKDASTELKCVTRNPAGRQEVVTHLQLEGKTAPSCSISFFFLFF